MPAGPGSVDSNGVYLYGESDSASPVSDMLNLGQSSISTQLTNDRGRLTNLETTANNPNVFVSPSATARDAKYGDPAILTATQRKALQDQGVLVWRTDLTTGQRFFALYNASTNPTGAAGTYAWYPAEGSVLFAGKRNDRTQSIPNAASTAVTFNTFMVVGGTAATEGIQINSATTPSIFTVKYAGWYQLSYNLPASAWSSTAGAARAINLNRNSTASSTNMLMYHAQGTGIGEIITETATVLLAVGDQLRVWVYQDSGGAATNNAIDFTITYLRPSQI